MISTNIFYQAIEGHKPLILDGAIGSYIQQKGFVTDNILWTTKINFENPEVIIKIHKEYIDAGADIITTNTFRTNPSALESKKTLKPADYIRQAVDLARQSKSESEVLIAGSNAPAEDCYQSERTISKQKLELNHRNHIDLLIDSGVDFILNETHSHSDEIMIICEHCYRNKFPFVISLYVTDTLQLLSGESLETILDYLKDFNPLIVGFNCISPKIFLQIIGSIDLPKYWGFYLNCGVGKPTDKIIECGVQPEEYLKYVQQSISHSPAFIGSCCGSSPAHTKKLREFLNGQHSS